MSPSTRLATRLRRTSRAEKEVTRVKAQARSSLPQTAFKDQTLARARELFLERGFDKTTMVDIAQAMNVSKPTIYTIYKSKHDLLADVIEHAVTDLDLAWIEAAAAENKSFERFMDHLAGRAYAIVSDPVKTQALLLLIKEGPQVQGLVDHFFETVWKKAGTAWSTVVTQAIERGECRAIDHRVAKRLIVAPFFLAVFEFGTLGAYPRNAELMQTFFKEYYDGLKLSLLKSGGKPWRSSPMKSSKVASLSAE
jgi:AcrR family transcriptional regulator